MNNPTFPVDPQRGDTGPTPGASNDPNYPEQPAVGSQQDRHDRDELGRVQNPQPAGSETSSQPSEMDRDDDEKDPVMTGSGESVAMDNPPSAGPIETTPQTDATTDQPGPGQMDQDVPGVGQADSLTPPSRENNDGL